MSDAVLSHIRWLTRRDLPAVLEIERQGFAHPWDEADFIGRLRDRCCIGLVLEVDSQIFGFMIYELHAGFFAVLNMAIATDYRRHGLGSRMIDKLKLKLEPQQRTQIRTRVSEANVDAQVFLRANRFKVAGVDRSGGEGRYLYDFVFDGSKTHD